MFEAIKYLPQQHVMQSQISNVDKQKIVVVGLRSPQEARNTDLAYFFPFFIFSFILSFSLLFSRIGNLGLVRPRRSRQNQAPKQSSV